MNREEENRKMVKNHPKECWRAQSRNSTSDETRQKEGKKNKQKRTEKKDS